VAHSYRLYSGFGRPHLWDRLPWRRDLDIPVRPVEELFPEIDFTRSAELLFPMPRNLGVSTQELNVLTKVVGHLQPKKVVEFGTAEGRTAVNIANYLPADGEIVTLDMPPVPGNKVGCFYWEQPVKSKIKQVRCGVGTWNSGPHLASAEVVFCDACDLMPGIAAEVFQAFSVVKRGGVIFRHDYGTVRATTVFWNWLARELPIFNIEGTTLLCLKVDSETYGKTQALLSHPILRNSVEIPSVDQVHCGKI
jgi:O-methyltransferase